MKHSKTLKSALRGGLLLMALIFQNTVLAQTVTVPPMDSVEISLLTCQPHDEVYSLYGHTAIRYHELTKDGIDAAFNYGVFNYDAPLFVIRFVFGLTDYELGAYPTDLFQEEYRRFGSMVTEQVLNLSNQEKLLLRQALIDNLKPEHRIYRYNYFYNNCTTKARDIIERHINGQVKYTDRENHSPTYREMVHQMTRNHPWARFGNDLLLGILSDKQTSRREQEFLPSNLLYDFDHARIYSNGSYKPLVKERRIIVPSGVQMLHGSFPLTPRQCGYILLFAGAMLAFMQWRQRRVFVLWDGLLTTASGIIGFVLFLMLFSQHPTVSLNFQFLFFNPVHIICLWSVLRGKAIRYWHLCIVMAVLFLIGSLFQTYAEGLYTLALCLLIQAIIHLFIVKRNEQ